MNLVRNHACVNLLNPQLTYRGFGIGAFNLKVCVVSDFLSAAGDHIPSELFSGADGYTFAQHNRN